MKTIIILLSFVPVLAVCQPNCNLLLLNKDTLQYNACIYVEENKYRYYQFDVRQCDIWEEAINICPYFPYPYIELSVPYLKSGDFFQWKKYIDKAVQLDPKNYLPFRAAAKYKFFGDYEGTIQDIDELQQLVQDVGYTTNGVYHLNTVKGLCLKGLGKLEKSLEVMEIQLNKDNHQIGLFDYLHLGVLYLQKEEYSKAMELFQLQEKENNLAENHYYAAIALNRLGKKEEAIKYLQTSKELYLKGRKMFDAYNESFDQIYLIEIDRELEKLNVK